MPKYVTRMSKSGESESYAVKDTGARELISQEVTDRTAAVSAEATARGNAIAAEADAREKADNDLKSALNKEFEIEFTSGYYISKTTGRKTAFSGGPYCASNYVNVHGLGSLVLFNACGSDDAGYAFLDNSMMFIEGGTAYISTTQNGITVIDVPHDAEWFGFSNYDAAWSKPYAYLVGYANSYKTIEIQEILDSSMIKYPFKFHGYGFTYIDKNTGEESENESLGCCASTWIPIASSTLYVTCFAPEGDAGYAFYDDRRTYISGGNCYYSNINYTPREIKINVPENAKYFRFSSDVAHGMISCASVKGFNDRANQYLYDNILFVDNYAYSLTGGGGITSLSGAAISDMLFLHEQKDLLKGYLEDVSYFYMTLYNKDNVFVGSLRNTGYYDTSGNIVATPIDYYSFAITLAGTYMLFATQEIYFVTPTHHIKIEVSTVPELENALLEAANNATPCRIYDIYIAEGTYDLWNGLDFTRISGNGDTAYHRGLEIPSYCNLYGLGECVLDLTVPSSGRSYSTVISCLNTHGVEASIHNIQLTTYDGRYCVHDDSFPNWTKQHTIVWENCVFDYRGRPDTTYTTAEHCYGAGFWSGDRAVFKNCVFKGGDGSGQWCGVAIHDHDSQIEPFYCEISDSAFLGTGDAVYLQAVVSDVVRTFDAKINGCFFEDGNYIYLKGHGGNRLFGGGNSSIQIRQDNTNEVYLVE